MKLTPHCGSAVRHPSLIYKSGSIQHSKTVQFPKLFSHSFPCFFVGPSPSITDQDCEKTYWVKLTPHCKVQDLFSATRQSKFQNSFHTFLFCFLSDRLLAYQIKTKNDTLWVKATPLLISYLSSISCTQIKIHKRGRCGGRQCSNGSPIFFFCLPRWMFFYCRLLQGVRDTCEKNLSQIH